MGHKLGFVALGLYIGAALAWIGEMIWISIQERRHPERFKGPPKG